MLRCDIFHGSSSERDDAAELYVECIMMTDFSILEFHNYCLVGTRVRKSKNEGPFAVHCLWELGHLTF